MGVGRWSEQIMYVLGASGVTQSVLAMHIRVCVVLFFGGTMYAYL